MDICSNIWDSADCGGTDGHGGMPRSHGFIYAYGILPSMILVTGGAGFIGSAFVHWLEREQPGVRVTALDANGVKTDANGAATITASVKRALNRDLEGAEHNWQIPRRNFATLNVDLLQQGVGGDNSWGALPYPQFRLNAKSYSYEILVQESK